MNANRSGGYFKPGKSTLHVQHVTVTIGESLDELLLFEESAQVRHLNKSWDANDNQLQDGKPSCTAVCALRGVSKSPFALFLILKLVDNALSAIVELSDLRAVRPSCWPFCWVDVMSCFEWAIDDDLSVPQLRDLRDALSLQCLCSPWRQNPSIG